MAILVISGKVFRLFWTKTGYSDVFERSIPVSDPEKT